MLSARLLTAWLLFYLAAFSQGNPIADRVNSPRRVLSPPVLPSEDEFYQVPPNIADFPNGAIIRYRKPPRPIANLGRFPVNLAQTYQILYKTTDGLDQPTATVLTVLIPYSADTRKILSYQVAEDSSNINCAPSYAFQAGSDASLGIVVTQIELLLIQAALKKNWIVIVPDHEGPTAAFLSNKLAGQAVLDGIRAALASNAFTGINNDKPTVTMWGYSGGSLASMWAAELQPIYAPELKIAGLAAGGVISKISTVLDVVNGEESAGLIPPGMQGLSHQYSELESIISKNIQPESQANYTKGNNQCLAANLVTFIGADVLSWFKNPDLVFQNKKVKSIISSNDLGQRVPMIPMFVYKAIRDEVSPVSESDALIASYCAQGSIIEYVRDHTANHTSMAIAGAPMALSWLEDRMEGRESRSSECTVDTVESTWHQPQSIRILPAFILNTLLAFLGKPVGVL